MTSMPASRRARATTLAPRSCPSRPGLAITTRIRPCATATSALSRPAVGACRPGTRARPDPRTARSHLGRYYRAGAAAPGERPNPVPRAKEQPRPVPKDRSQERIAYLPSRAAGARKLVLRSQLGVPWLLAAVLFGLVILVAGVLFLVKAGRPGAPWERVAPVARFADGTVTQAPYRADEVLVVDRRGAGQAWGSGGEPAPTARAASPPPPLRAVPVTVAKGELYVDAPRPHPPSH